MLKRYMHNRERYFAMRDDDRIVHPFDWGTEFVMPGSNGDDPRKLFRDYARRTVENSDEFFFSPDIRDYRLGSSLEVASSEEAGRPLTWTSGVSTTSPENNTVRARYFPTGNDKRSAVIILPHWNAKAGTYFSLARLFNRFGMSALRLTLPYHEERMPPECNRADYLVAPNVGRTLQSLRQAVVDTRSALKWLKEQGYEKVGIVGTSIGSCVGFFAFVHDLRIDAACFNHVSGYPADVVWHGLSTYHVKESLADNVTLDELREYWLPISPMAYLDRLAKLPQRPQRYIYTLYDLSFPVDLSRDVMREIRLRNIPHGEVTIPCGHYTLGEKPWVYIDGYKIVSFLRKHLK
ncbi:MAG: alpha/beta hydrolase family protein [Pyrinomonadaceae bacterium]